MEESPRPDFKQYSLPPVSKKYLLRILFYIVMLSAIAVIALSSLGKHRKMEPEKVQEVSGIQIEITDSL